MSEPHRNSKFLIYVISNKTNFTNIKEKAQNETYWKIQTSLCSCIVTLGAVFDNDPIWWLWESEYTGYGHQSQKTKVPQVLVVLSLFIHY